jgi:hypothetical protein
MCHTLERVRIAVNKPDTNLLDSMSHIIAASSVLGGYARPTPSIEVQDEPGGVSIVAAVRRRPYSSHQPLRSAVFEVKSACSALAF